jgi:hypothetical protein
VAPQLVEPCGLVQLVPHAPQLLFVERLVSQPSDVALLQSPKPDKQLTNWQLPVEQLVVALGRLQGVPQPPQLALVFSWVSQPSVCAFLLQSPKPELQAIAH